MIYYEELVHVVMEAEKSPDLPSTSWRFRKASGIVQSRSEGPRTKGADGVISNVREEKTDVSDPTCGKGVNSAFL